ncbi:hypothetical protein ACIRBX_20275, partial [Kitasatospora sp. NPDC096147]|uniref:hypothetical protein n=1 Tax=Kitasatospora sp. NPDC096147 TaxID=3364093 RepID=UPI00382432BD
MSLSQGAAGSPQFTQAVPTSAGVPLGAEALAGAPEFTRAVPTSAGVPLREGTLAGVSSVPADGTTPALKVGA